eukprot:m.457687 g.457687  ORF g.457687 m.457687 type:complete len:488 (+) comp21327_c0_seq1:348-1811(+)
MARGTLRISRSAGLAALAASVFLLWVAIQQAAHKSLQEEGSIGGHEPRQQHTDELDESKTNLSDSCELRCNSDAAVRLPDGLQCECNSKACHTGQSDPCCLSYGRHCSHVKTNDNVSSISRRSVPKPQRFPPLHHGPELVFLDAVFTYCWSRRLMAAHMGPKELVEWLEYMRFAGVGRFLLYDCSDPSDPDVIPLSQDKDIFPYIHEGYVVSVPWYDHGDNVDTAAARAAIYSDAHRRYGKHASVWRLVFDPLEYPVVIGDANAGFLTKLLVDMSPGVGLVRIGVSVVGGQTTGLSHATDHRALRYRSRTRTEVPGEDRYVIRLTSATGYGKHKAGTSLSVHDIPATDVLLFRILGPLVGAASKYHCTGATDVSCVAFDQFQERENGLTLALHKVIGLIETSTLFPGIPSGELRKRLMKQWIFNDVYGAEGDSATNDAKANKLWEKTRADIRKFRQAKVEAHAKIESENERQIDEFHALVWPPPGWQ